MCPDCPGPIDLSDPKVMEAATESLAKFNSENPSKQYSVVKVTRATGQVKLKCPGQLHGLQLQVLGQEEAV